MRLGAFGDVVRSLPAAYAVRRQHPGAHLAWLVEDGSAPLLRRLDWLDEVIEFPRQALEADLASRRPGRLLRGVTRVRRALRAREFDAVLDLHGGLKSAVLTRFTGAARRIGLAAGDAREGAALFYTEHVSLGGVPCSRWERNAALASHLGAVVDTRAVPGLRGASAEGAPLTRGPHAVLHPGSSGGTAYKRYPIERFAEVARELAAEFGAPCRVTCGPDPEEGELARALVAAAGAAARLESTEGDIERLISALSNARVVLSGDTGPLHLASLLGTPVVQILGPTDPVQNTPWPGTPWRRAHLPLPCSPCRRGCDAAPCLALLPASDVVSAVHGVLADSASAEASVTSSEEQGAGGASQGEAGDRPARMERAGSPRVGAGVSG